MNELNIEEKQLLIWLCNEYINNGIAEINGEVMDTMKIIEKLEDESN